MSVGTQVAIGNAKPVLAVRRKPSAAAQSKLNECAMQLLNEGFGYREAVALLRQAMLSKALILSDQSKTKAARRLLISREHLSKYHSRGKELL